MDVLFTVAARSFNHRCSGKAIIITYSGCVFITLGTQHAMCVILSSVGCPALQYFSTYSHKLHDFRGTIFLNIKYVF